MNNLIIIGTSHIARESIKEVEDVITKEKPDIVAIELDRKRLYALTTKKKGRAGFWIIRKIGLKGYLFSIIGEWAERKLGEYVGMSPGSEMLAAVKLAKKNEIKLALIDQDIEITLRKFSASFSWREKWNFLVDIVRGVVFRKKEIDFDLSKVPSKKIVSTLLSKVKKRYPTVYKVLVKDRNRVMARNLARIMADYPDKKIVAIVGAGHEDEILDLIKKEKKGIVSFSYSFNVKA